MRPTSAVSFFFVLSGFILTYNYATCSGMASPPPTNKRFVWVGDENLSRSRLTLLLVLPIAIFSPHLPLDWRRLPFHLLLLQCFWRLRHRRFPAI